MGRVLFIACTNVGQAMIETIRTNPSIKSEIVGIVNLNAIRGMNKANYHTYADVAEKYGIPLHYCDNINDPETMEWILERKPDLIIQTGWSQKFRSSLLHAARFGCIGEHPAPLPVGRGAACVNWAILSGKTQWGDTFFRMVDEYDRGDVYAQAFFEIKPYDTVKTVYDKVALASSKIIAENIDQWTEGLFSVIDLDETKATYYKRRTPADGLFSFEMGAKELHDFIRAQTEPYPGAFFMRGSEKVTVLLSKPCAQSGNGTAPGTVLNKTADGGILVSCGKDTAIELLRYRLSDGIERWFSEAECFPIGEQINKPGAL